MASLMTEGVMANRLDAAVSVLALLALPSGLFLIRASEAFESYLMLFAAFGLIIWGLMATFTEHGRPSLA